MKLPVPSFAEIVRLRQSVRRFASRPVEREKLERIKEVGRLAASADNRQPWRFFLLHREGRGKFDSLLRENFRGAPVVIVACASPAAAWRRRFDGRSYAWVDVSIAVTEMILAATAEGLGTCWVASIDPAAVRTFLGLGEEWEPVTAVALGYPEEPLEVKTRNRKLASEVWEER